MHSSDLMVAQSTPAPIRIATPVKIALRFHTFILSAAQTAAIAATSVKALLQLIPRELSDDEKFQWLWCCLQNKSITPEHFDSIFDALILTAESCNFRGMNCLHTACFIGSCELIRHVLQRFPEIDKSSVGEQHANALHYAAWSGCREAMQYVADNFAALAPQQQAGNDGATALHFACLSGSVAAIKYATNNLGLSKRSTYTYDRRNALHCACWSGSPAAITYVAENFPEEVITQTDRQQRNPLHYAAWSGSPEAIACVLQLFLRKWWKFSVSKWWKFSVSTYPKTVYEEDGRHDSGVRIYDQGIELWNTANYGENALHHACRSGSPAAIDYVVKHFRVIKGKKPYGSYLRALYDTAREYNCLHYACGSGSPAAIEYVLNNFYKQRRGKVEFPICYLDGAIRSISPAAVVTVFKWLIFPFNEETLYSAFSIMLEYLEPCNSNPYYSDCHIVSRTSYAIAMEYGHHLIFGPTLGVVRKYGPRLNFGPTLVRLLKPVLQTLATPVLIRASNKVNLGEPLRNVLQEIIAPRIQRQLLADLPELPPYAAETLASYVPCTEIPIASVHAAESEIFECNVRGLAFLGNNSNANLEAAVFSQPLDLFTTAISRLLWEASSLKECQQLLHIVLKKVQAATPREIVATTINLFSAAPNLPVQRREALCLQVVNFIINRYRQKAKKVLSRFRGNNQEKATTIQNELDRIKTNNQSLYDHLSNENSALYQHIIGNKSHSLIVGDDVVSSSHENMRMLLGAANLDNAPAMKKLGRMYQEGLAKGGQCASNFLRAIYWYARYNRTVREDEPISLFNLAIPFEIIDFAQPLLSDQVNAGQIKSNIDAILNGNDEPLKDAIIAQLAEEIGGGEFRFSTKDVCSYLIQLFKPDHLAFTWYPTQTLRALINRVVSRHHNKTFLQQADFSIAENQATSINDETLLISLSSVLNSERLSLLQPDDARLYNKFMSILLKSLQFPTENRMPDERYRLIEPFLQNWDFLVTNLDANNKARLVARVCDVYTNLAECNKRLAVEHAASYFGSENFRNLYLTAANPHGQGFKDEDDEKSNVNADMTNINSEVATAILSTVNNKNKALEQQVKVQKEQAYHKWIAELREIKQQYGVALAEINQCLQTIINTPLDYNHDRGYYTMTPTVKAAYDKMREIANKQLQKRTTSCARFFTSPITTVYRKIIDKEYPVGIFNEELLYTRLPYDNDSDFSEDSENSENSEKGITASLI